LLRLSAGCHGARLRNRAQARVKAATNTGSFGYLPPSWCHAHHIVPGTTSLDNGVLLCGHHHRLIHNGPWQVVLAADGHPDFLPPPWIDPDRKPLRNHTHDAMLN